MTMKHILSGSILALALASAASNSAQASNVPQYNPGDLLLGFYSKDSSVTNDYIVDLGPVSNFNFTQAFTLSGATTHLATDLSSTFGSNWYGLTTLYYGLNAGDAANDFVYTSNPNATPFRDKVDEGTAESTSVNVGNNYSNQTQTHSEQDPNGYVQATSANSSYKSAAPTFGGWSGTAGDNGIDGLTNTSLQFDYLPAGDTALGTNEGTFSLDSAGDLKFAPPAAIPEPSTFAAIGMGAVILLAARRRRSSVSV